jgi:hypothetical protein
MPVTAGIPVTAQAVIRVPAATRTARVYLAWFDDAGVQVGVNQIGTDITANATGWTLATVTATPDDGATSMRAYIQVINGTAVGETFWYTEFIAESDTSGPYFDGDMGLVDAFTQNLWLGTPNASMSIQQTREFDDTPVFPVKNLSTEDILYGDRVTSYRWEIIGHASNGVDSFVGNMDGVSDGSIKWTLNAQVKGGGSVSVVDIDEAAPGLIRIGDLSLPSLRLRPVCSIEGLPDIYLGIFLVTNAKEEWDDTGRVWDLELLDKCTVPQQDSVDQSYAVAAGTLILKQVQTILATCGETIAIDNGNTLATSTGLVWEAGTSKLQIINDLLDVAGYNALWMDGMGNFQATPRVLPAKRDPNYALLGIPRVLEDGEQAIYSPQWEREADSFDVPNKVVTVQAAGGTDAPALTGQWTNQDPTSPYSYQSRGRWIVNTVSDVDCPAGTTADIQAFLNSRAQTTLIQQSAVQAQVDTTHLPIPIAVGDVVQFVNSEAGIDAMHVITSTELDTHPLGLMKSSLQEVISL